ncbi:Mdm20p SCDLUD_002554 [Saccharomycodes ludwigii]|uniref:Mdm20p n=1 Tax=Saccharomycodes ludwigii TaxID=36035 RepID=UPI001E8A382D|nr:hypothetical protein SCDLUD_002554 [Saccharomycodes ludwigii]KAH3901079.1 hypothetical protein SCDLUD_002554 [Saccharomycodes ludwigii]
MNTQVQQVLNILQNDNASYKQAITITNQLVVKFPSVTLYKVLNQYSKYKQSPNKYLAPSSKNIDALRQLIDKTVPNDSLSLEWLYKLLTELWNFDESLKIYDNAMFKYRNYQTSYDWFLKSLKVGDLLNCYKSTKLMFNFVGNRDNDTSEFRRLCFWNAVFAIMHYKNVSKFGDSTAKLEKLKVDLLQNEVLIRLESKKPFVNDQERIVYCQLCEILGQEVTIVDELYPLLVKQNGNLDLYLKNIIINCNTDLSKAWEICTKLLENLNDYLILQKLIDVGYKMGKQKQDVLDHLNSYESFNKSRNFMLIKFELDRLYSVGEGSIVTAEHLEEYVLSYYNKPCFCIDLQNIYRDASPAISSEVLIGKITKIVGDKGISSDIYQYNLYELDSKTYNQKLLSNYPEYVVAKVRRKIMEASSDISLDTRIVLECCYMLEQQIKVTPNEYELHLWLCALYSQMGFSNVAQDHYYRCLKIKNIQVDILDHILHSRYSTITAVKTNVSTGMDNVYTSMERLPRFIEVGLERESYSKINGMYELYARLQLSFTRLYKLVDQLIISRTFNDPKLRKELSGKLLALLEFNYHYKCTVGENHRLRLSDNRDLKIFGCDNVTKIWLSSNSYMNINETWLFSMIVKELMIQDFAENSNSNLKYIEYFVKNCDVDTAFTKVEDWSFNIIKKLYKGECADNVLGLLEEYEGFFVDKYGNNYGWLIPHTYGVVMNLFKTLDGIKRVGSLVAANNFSLRKYIKEQLNKLRTKYCPTIFQDHYKSNIEKILSGADGAIVGFDDEFKSMILDNINKMYKNHKNL